MKAGVRNLLFILPVLLFVALAGYFALALRSGDPHQSDRRFVRGAR